MTKMRVLCQHSNDWMAYCAFHVMLAYSTQKTIDFSTLLFERLLKKHLLCYSTMIVRPVFVHIKYNFSFTSKIGKHVLA